MKILAFVAQWGGQAGQPGAPLKSMAMRPVVVDPKNPATPDNTQVFTGSSGMSGVNLQGLTDTALAEFAAGQKVIITIEAAPPDVAPAPVPVGP